MKKALLIIWLIITTTVTILTLRDIYLNSEYNENLKAQETLDSGLGSAQEQFSRDLADLIQYADSLGYNIRMGEVYRTREQQVWYLNHGLSKTMNSWHRKKLAVDINLFLNGRYLSDGDAYAILGRFWQSKNEEHFNEGLEYRWGGSWGRPADTWRDSGFKDIYHFEIRR
jgi:hypothetical protein